MDSPQGFSKVKVSCDGLEKSYTIPDSIIQYNYSKSVLDAKQVFIIYGILVIIFIIFSGKDFYISMFGYYAWKDNKVLSQIFLFISAIVFPIIGFESLRKRLELMKMRRDVRYFRQHGTWPPDWQKHLSGGGDGKGGAVVQSAATEKEDLLHQISRLTAEKERLAAQHSNAVAEIRKLQGEGAAAEIRRLEGELQAALALAKRQQATLHDLGRRQASDSRTGP